MNKEKMNYTRSNNLPNNNPKAYKNNTHKNYVKNNTISNSKAYSQINNFTNYNYFILGLSITIPLIIFFLLMLIYYRIKKRMKLKKQKENYKMNDINKEKTQNKKSYKKILNTSGFNNIVNQNENNLSEIKVQNMKEEMNNIISNSGSSSGRRKRENRKIGGKKGKNISEFDNKEGQKEMQNEIKEQIKQFVIEEHNNNNE